MAPNPQGEELVRVCVIHDPATGQIHHIHTLVLLPGEDEPTEAEIAARAFQGAQRLRPRDMGHLRPLHVRPGALPARHVHRVDVATGTIVSEPISGPGPPG
jgi:hypothetical protein